MIVSYLLRLACVELASFFVVHLVVGLIAWLAAPAAVRVAERMRPSRAACFLLAYRLLPAGFAVLIAAALCLPAYLRLEPEAGAEHVRIQFLGAALLGLFAWSASLARGLRATIRLRRFNMLCQRAGHRLRLPREFSPAWAIEEAEPFLALAGILRPRFVISRGMLAALSPDQLRAALRHERAHCVSRDNLKRLLILLAPDLVPFVRGFGELERAWAKFTEWAADDAAVAGNSRRSVSLAAALVSVARLGSAPTRCALATSLLPDSNDLPARVNRLLQETPSGSNETRMVPVVLAGGLVILAGLLVAWLQPTTLEGAYWALEHLIN